MRAHSRRRAAACAASALRATSLLAGLLLATGAAGAQSLPSLQQYPLRDRVFGSGGAFFPDYVTPSDYSSSYLIGRGSTKGAIFAAGTADYNCQQTQVPTITVLSAPQPAKVKVRYGSFLATGIDGGSGIANTKCVGQTMKGMVVTYKGRAAPGDTVTLRVTYPTLGAWYDHVVPVSAR